ncbi:MAG: 30S ribosomal protein S7 [Candidatus Marinimicrobia bacterium]|nr:30S ribosomal protein S7 [Candidatus Neomarinimicrobiota bacterium]MBT3680885.1 30S ribosomal protein S7 [Candidatus Neomarinimicrobiota bacterium]MBT3824192.1 30S ribosomal protein S7 [Candidatus Neomarinimicrobiota bacterium]MBT3949501.1 30S ribosomal protein S7 [Candidatus Neomarinimicrobiota bacterium]MBT4129427.1 30S ribosomal protein S7 [Candidatus Neomarinimicrobiota bacterium]
MMRRRRPEKRSILPDPVYNDVGVARFINYLMERGKKGLSEKILYGSFDIIQQKTKSDPLELFKKAIENVAPIVEVKSKRVGGATYQVPVEVRTARRQALAYRWIISYSKKRSQKTMSEKLAAELIGAANNEGGSIKKREDTHRMAEANKAFAHFR